MAYTKTGGTCRVPSASQQPKTIVGRDRLNWRHAEGRLLLYHGDDRNPLLTVEPDSKYTGMYRIRFPDGGLSDMANLTRAKDAAMALALRNLNSGHSGAQETPPPAGYVRKKRAKVGSAADSLCKAPWLSCGGPVMKRRNSISGQFAARLIEMLESPAYRVLSQSGHMVLARIEIELASHGGNDNGRLPVTTENFVQYGMHRTSVAPALREAEALGFIRITERGHGGNAEYRSPNRFYLTYALARDSRSHPPTHEWRRNKTLQEANEIARTARNNKSRSAVERASSLRPTPRVSVCR